MQFLVRAKGFTLVELLVVMTIIAVAMGLVGGLAVNGYTKFQIKAEIMTIERLVNRAAILSFTTEQAITLVLEQNTVVMRSAQKQLFSQKFEYSELPNESVVFNRKGIPNKKQITVKVSDKFRNVSLVLEN